MFDTIPINVIHTWLDAIKQNITKLHHSRHYFIDTRMNYYQMHQFATNPYIT